MACACFYVSYRYFVITEYFYCRAEPSGGVVRYKLKGGTHVAKIWIEQRLNIVGVRMPIITAIFAVIMVNGEGSGWMEGYNMLSRCF